mgnify:FL=1
MKRITLFAALATSMAALATPALAADVGVSVSVAEPGFYGRIDIGNLPQPQVIYTKPVVIAPAPVVPGVVVQPLYLRVPPGHAKKWRKHCHEYNACGQPVYFVRERWYNDVYVPRYNESRGGPPGEGRGRGRDDDRGDHGHGERGHGHGRGH